ncbi:MAG: hypothetical protein HQL35_16190 [Alphaproteobacteria bacterium]|nr:hypothetical protein [Alphaproteobacteria bacterium]
MAVALAYWSNIEDVERLLTDLEKQHLPFAVARALTRAAYESRDAVRADIANRFTLRTRRAQQGVRVHAAKYRKGVPLGALQADVHTLDWYMEDQETGGLRGRTPSGHRRAVPTLHMRRGGTFQGKVKKRARSTLLETRAGTRKRKKKASAAPRPFLVRVSPQTEVIFVREGRGRLPILPLFVLTDRVRVRPRLGMDETTRDTMARRFGPLLVDSLRDALKGNRYKGEPRPMSNAALDHLSEHGGFGGPVAYALAR